MADPECFSRLIEIWTHNLQVISLPFYKLTYLPGKKFWLSLFTLVGILFLLEQAYFFYWNNEGALGTVFEQAAQKQFIPNLVVTLYTNYKYKFLVSQKVSHN